MNKIEVGAVNKIEVGAVNKIEVGAVNKIHGRAMRARGFFDCAPLIMFL